MCVRRYGCRKMALGYRRILSVVAQRDYSLTGKYCMVRRGQLIADLIPLQQREALELDKRLCH